MEHVEALHSFISDMVADLVKFTPLHVLCAVAIIAVVACLVSRAKDGMVIVMSAALYAIPFLLPFVMG